MGFSPNWISQDRIIDAYGNKIYDRTEMLKKADEWYYLNICKKREWPKIEPFVIKPVEPIVIKPVEPFILPKPLFKTDQFGKNCRCLLCGKHTGHYFWCGNF